MCAYAAQPNGATPPTNPLSTKQSNLHYDVAKNDMGYSTVGSNAGTVGTQYAQYRDGVVNPYLHHHYWNLLTLHQLPFMVTKKETTHTLGN